MRSRSIGVFFRVFTLLYAWCVGRAQAAKSPDAGETKWINANGLRLKTRLYKSENLGSHPRLIVVLHGDSPFGPPSYQYEFARRAAVQIENVVAAAILRPGYTDEKGERSDGERGLTTGDNYTPEVVDAVADVAKQLKGKFDARGTVLVGHSGGAAISAAVLGRYPSEVDAVLLISCPCNLSAWRKHMFHAQRDPVWLAPVKSLSALDLVGEVPPSTRVRMLVGSDDPVVPPDLTHQYGEALRKRGVPIAVTIAPGLKHNILLEPIALEELRKLLHSIRPQSDR